MVDDHSLPPEDLSAVGVRVEDPGGGDAAVQTGDHLLPQAVPGEPWG